MANLHGAESVCLFEYGRIYVWSRFLFALCYNYEKVEGKKVVEERRSSEEGTLPGLHFSKNSHLKIKDKTKIR